MPRLQLLGAAYVSLIGVMGVSVKQLDSQMHFVGNAKVAIAATGVRPGVKGVVGVLNLK